MTSVAVLRGQQSSDERQEADRCFLHRLGRLTGGPARLQIHSSIHEAALLLRCGGVTMRGAHCYLPSGSVLCHGI